MNRTWYTASAGDQGLIIEESTGRNVAVSYDAKDAPLIAAAPDMFAVLEMIENIMHSNEKIERGSLLHHETMAAIAKAKGY